MLRVTHGLERDDRTWLVITEEACVGDWLPPGKMDRCFEALPRRHSAQEPCKVVTIEKEHINMRITAKISATTWRYTARGSGKNNSTERMLTREHNGFQQQQQQQQR